VAYVSKKKTDKLAKVSPVAAPARKVRAKAAAAAESPVKTAEITPVAAPVTSAKPAAPLVAAVEKGTKTMNDTVKTVEETVKKATAEASTKATEMFKDLTTRAKTAMEKGTDLAKEAVEFNKANLEAVVESGKVVVKGAQTAAQTAAEVTRKNFDSTTAMLKSAAAVKTPTDLFKLQGDFARSQFDGAVAEMSKATEFYTKLAGEIFAPMQNRYTVATEQVKARMAA
jgi:phasin family protein